MALTIKVIIELGHGVNNQNDGKRKKISYVFHRCMYITLHSQHAYRLFSLARAFESGPPGPKRVPHGRPVKQTNKQTYLYERNYVVTCSIFKLLVTVDRVYYHDDEFLERTSHHTVVFPSQSRVTSTPFWYNLSFQHILSTHIS